MLSIFSKLLRLKSSTKLKGRLKTKSEVQVFEAQKNISVTYLTHHYAPFTGGGELLLRIGEKIIVPASQSSSTSSVYCSPVNYSKIECLIPIEERTGSNYGSYSLHISTESLISDFKKINLMPLHYTKGDATAPQLSGNKIIVHICNDVGGWGKGFVIAISERWSAPEATYRNWFKNKISETSDKVEFQRVEHRDKYSDEKKFELGNVQFVKVEADLWVANMIAQTGIKRDKEGNPPIRYPFVSEGIERVREFAKVQHASVHMPRIGCGLAGGNWDTIEPIISEELIAHGIDTTVYDFG